MTELQSDAVLHGSLPAEGLYKYVHHEQDSEVSTILHVRIM